MTISSQALCPYPQVPYRLKEDMKSYYGHCWGQYDRSAFLGWYWGLNVGPCAY
jgi:hypothetical protein